MIKSQTVKANQILNCAQESHETDTGTLYTKDPVATKWVFRVRVRITRSPEFGHHSFGSPDSGSAQAIRIWYPDSGRLELTTQVTTENRT